MIAILNIKSFLSVNNLVARVGNVILCRKAFKRIHSIGNLRLSRIQTRIKKDPTFYSDDYQGWITRPSTHIAISWMHDLFSKHGESMLNRETIHIPDNFTRQEIYKLYKDYVQGGQRNGNFFTYGYFTRVWKKKFNKMKTFQRGQGWGSVVHVLLLKRYVYKIVYFLDRCQL